MSKLYKLIAVDQDFQRMMKEMALNRKTTMYNLSKDIANTYKKKRQNNTKEFKIDIDFFW